MHTGSLVRPAHAEKEKVLQLIDRNYGQQIERNKEKLPDIKRRSHTININKSIITIVDDIIHEALRLRASDIHFEPFEREMAIRFRIDGVLQEIGSIPKTRVAEVISRIKIMVLRLKQKVCLKSGKFLLSISMIIALKA